MTTAIHTLFRFIKSLVFPGMIEELRKNNTPQAIRVPVQDHNPFRQSRSR